MNLVLLFALLSLAAARYRPPPPLPASAPAARFSAARARAAFERALGSEAPHPVGSDHDGEVRERLVAQLFAMGYRAEVIEGAACGASRACARVRSIVARRDGREPGPAVWLNAHYDSVWAGPAVSDDGAGVAAGLEVARALAAEPPHRRAIALLFNEGEEPGLLGAEALVKQKAFLDDVYAVVNLEARGTDGPSLMFETSPGNAGLIDLYARSVSRPMSNSLYYAVYRTLPNDTDLTVFKRAGLPGYGFAFIGGTARYHTPLDDLRHGDLGSLQHHGENALAMVRALADQEVALRGGDAFFFDVYAWFVARGPVWLLRALTALAALLWVLALRKLRPRAFGGALAFVGCLAATAAVGVGVLRLLNPPFPWLAHPLAIRALFICLPLAVTALVGSLSEPIDLWAGAWTVLLLVAGALAATAPEVPYFLVLPALLAGALALAGLPAAAVSASAAATAALMMPVAHLLYAGLGTVLLPASAALWALMFALALPLLPRRSMRPFAAAAGALSLALLLAAFLAPPFSRDNPKHENVVLLADADAHTSRWLIEGTTALDGAFRSVAQFSQRPEPPLQWLPRYRAFVAPGPAVSLEPPRLQGVRFQGNTLFATLVSPRGGRRAGLLAPEGRVRALRFAGQSAPPQQSKNRIAMSAYTPQGMADLRWETMTAAGVPVEIDLVEAAPIEVVLWDQSPGVPADGAALVGARPPDACAVQDGDRTLVVHTQQLSP